VIDPGHPILRVLVGDLAVGRTAGPVVLVVEIGNHVEALCLADPGGDAIEPLGGQVGGDQPVPSVHNEPADPLVAHFADLPAEFVIC